MIEFIVKQVHPIYAQYKIPKKGMVLGFEYCTLVVKYSYVDMALSVNDIIELKNKRLFIVTAVNGARVEARLLNTSNNDVCTTTVDMLGLGFRTGKATTR